MGERRYGSELRAEGRELIGVAMRYGDSARVYVPRYRRVLTERIAAGAFAPLGDVILDIAHNPARPVARTPTLELRDGPAALELRVAIPPTPTGDELLEGVASGLLRGLSVDMVVLSDSLSGDRRDVRRARLDGIAVVPRAAYGQTTAEIRIDDLGLSGEFRYGVTEIVGAGQGAEAVAQRQAAELRRGSVRKRRVARGAFRRALTFPDREVQLVAGRNFDRTIGSRSTGALQLRETDRGVQFRIAADRIPPTTWAGDLFAQIRSGSIRAGVQANYTIPDGGAKLTPERPGDTDRLVQTVTEARLTALEILMRPARVDGDQPLGELWLGDGGPNSDWDWSDALFGRNAAEPAQRRAALPWL